MTRIYLITDKHRQNGFHRLVRAANQAQARNHVARDSLSCEVAGQDDLVELIARGVKVEDTGEVLQVGAS